MPEKRVDSTGQSGRVYASPDEIEAALDQMGDADWLRLRGIAGSCLPGTCYGSTQDLINEAVTRALSAAHGGDGRAWPKGVPFMAFMVMTVKGLASDSRDSASQRDTVYAEDLMAAAPGITDPSQLARQAAPSAESEVSTLEERQLRDSRGARDLAAIKDRFRDDEEIQWILLGCEEDLGATEIRELSGMTQVQYESARKRFNRGVQALFPNRRKA